MQVPKTYLSRREIFEFIVGLVDERNLAWDCANLGMDRPLVVLADYFKQVIASDISTQQIENAQRKSRQH